MPKEEKVTFLFSPIIMSRIPVKVPLNTLLLPRNITSSGIRISPFRLDNESCSTVANTCEVGSAVNT